ncbi:hypothetical protein D3C73_1569400 [compost metagenome]
MSTPKIKRSSKAPRNLLLQLSLMVPTSKNSRPGYKGRKLKARNGGWSLNVMKQSFESAVLRCQTNES